MRLPNWALGAIVGCVCAVAVAPRAVVGDQSLLPWSALVYDPVFTPADSDKPPVSTVWDASGLTIHYPAQLLAANELRAGRAPLWNHRLGTGAPLLAEAHSAPMSPMMLPFWLSPSEATYALFMLLRLLLAAMGTFLVARQLKRSLAASTLAAATYAIGGCAAARFHLPTEGSAYAMLPFVALAAGLAVSGRRGAVPILALTVGLTISVAHPELAALAGVGGCMMALSYTYDNKRAWLRVGSGLGLGVVTAAVIVVPFLSYLFSAASYKKEPGFASFFVSDFSYFRLAPDIMRFGAAPLVLAGIAVVSWRSDSARAAMARVAVAALGLFVLLLALQSWVAPPIGSAVPPRYSLFLLVFAIALLAADGLDLLVDTPLSDKTLAMGIGVGAAIWLAGDFLANGLLHQLSDIWSGDLICALLVPLSVILLRNRKHWSNKLAWTIAVLTAFTLAMSFQRVIHTTGEGAPNKQLRAKLNALPKPPARVVGLNKTMTPNIASHFGAADPRAAAALYPKRYRKYWSLIPDGQMLPTSVGLTATGSPLVDLLGAQRVDERGVASAGKAMPRAFIPSRLTAATDMDDAANKLLALTNVRTGAVVETSDAVLAPLRGGNGRVTIVSYAAGRVVLEVDATKPSLVVLTDTFDPGWTTRVDGKTQAIHPVDVLFRGVAVPAGKHRIVMTYRPASFTAGLWISALAILACLGWLAWGRWGHGENTGSRGAGGRAVHSADGTS